MAVRGRRTNELTGFSVSPSKKKIHRLIHSLVKFAVRVCLKVLSEGCVEGRLFQCYR